MARRHIPHIFEGTIEKKLCSHCKEYKELGEYYEKKDRWDKLSNECVYCASLRNKRRQDPTFTFPEEVKTRQEVEAYLATVRYLTPKRREKLKLEEEKQNENNNTNKNKDDRD